MSKGFYEKLNEDVPVKYVAFISVALFGTGFFFGSVTNTSSYNTKCSDLLESREINYTGSIDEYSTPGLSNNLFFSSDDEQGGVFLMDSDRLAVQNSSRLDFGFTQKMWIECSDGRITVDTYFSDENVLEDKSQENGEGENQ